MKRIDWNPDKNNRLRAEPGRDIGFEDIVAAIDAGGLLDDVAHPNSTKYPRQRVLVVAVNDYVYAVPYVKTDTGLFLKTAFPSCRLKALYMPDANNSKERPS